MISEDVKEQIKYNNYRGALKLLADEVNIHCDKGCLHEDPDKQVNIIANLLSAVLFSGAMPGLNAINDKFIRSTGEKD